MKPNNPLSLALLYHLNSLPPTDYFTTVPAQELRYISEGPLITLPKVVKDTQLISLLEKRKSAREFQNCGFPLNSLAQVLYAGCGVTGKRQIDEYSFESRTIPSAGGLYPIEVFVALQKMEGIPNGLYHYEPRGHELNQVGEVTPETFVESFLYQDYIGNASALIFLTAVFMRTMHKYGARGYRFALLEAGHLAQNMCLMATELKLGSLCIGGFDDIKVNKLLSLDGRRHSALYCVALGKEGL